MRRRNNGVTFWTVETLVRSAQSCSAGIVVNGKALWVPARPLGWTSIPARLKEMLMVWRGQADIVTWPHQ
jgi:hypothetical protein